MKLGFRVRLVRRRKRLWFRLRVREATVKKTVSDTCADISQRLATVEAERDLLRQRRAAALLADVSEELASYK